MRTPLHSSAAAFGLPGEFVDALVGIERRWGVPREFALYLQQGKLSNLTEKLEHVLDSDDIKEKFDAFVQQMLHLYGGTRTIRKSGTELTLKTRGSELHVTSSTGAKMVSRFASQDEALQGMQKMLQEYQEKREASEELENPPKRRRVASPSKTASNCSISDTSVSGSSVGSSASCANNISADDKDETEEKKNLRRLLNDELIQVQGSAARPYDVRCRGGVFYCTCMAWRNQRMSVDLRTCKHLRQLLGEEHETKRCGSKTQVTARAKKARADKAALIKSGGAPKVMLAHKFSDKTDPQGWLLSEKLDGVRAYWNGTQFVSRQGNVFYAPAWFVQKLPSEHLDGELWTGRSEFQQCVSIVRSHDKSDSWKKVTYRVFDAPQVSGGFEERLGKAKKLVAQCEVANVVEHVVCRGHDHLQEELTRILDLGGEGLMLRKAGSAYRGGRTNDLLKVKKFDDDDAIVIEHVAGKGRHTGVMGALRCRLRNGKQFKVGSGFSDSQRAAPPAIGSIVSFKYQGLTNAGIPRFPIFLRLRTDIDKKDF